MSAVAAIHQDENADEVQVEPPSSKTLVNGVLCARRCFDMAQMSRQATRKRMKSNAAKHTKMPPTHNGQVTAKLKWAPPASGHPSFFILNYEFEVVKFSNELNFLIEISNTVTRISTSHTPKSTCQPLIELTLDTMSTNRRSSTPLLSSGSLLRVSSPRRLSNSVLIASSLQWMNTYGADPNNRKEGRRFSS